MSTKQKLELNWIGKHKRPRLEPRILLEDNELSYGDANSENLLIHGDNLLALKALEQKYAGKVKCVFIDPPYNTGSAFTHYDDGLEHSLWLCLIRDRLELLRTLLSDDGSIWITIDDHEVHYLKCLCDEIFGRNNFISNVIWEKSDSPRMDAAFFSSRHDHLLVYAKDQSKFKVKRQPLSLNDLPSHYDKVDPNGNPYYLKPLRAMGQADKREDRPTMYFPLVAPDGTEIYPKRQDGTDGRWRWGVQKIEQEKWRIDWSNGRNGWTPYFRVYADSSSGRPPETIWFHSEVGSNRTSKAEIKKVIPAISAFDTPKPEALIKKILEIATDGNDLVLDSFAGSGTTGAVAQKMVRRWIMIELGDHCRTHIVPRLKKVIDGEDQGGITKSVNWQGGGGFRYLRLAPSLLKKDHWGNWVINKEYNAEMLAEAMCKHMNFTYAPSQTQYWNHGYSTETDYIYVTTGSLAYEQLKVLSEEVGTERTLLICCKAFMTEGADFPNLTLVKIPRAILSKCEWDHDDYSFTLNVLSDSEHPDVIDYDENTEDEESL
ncbi:site-specific DNA-methyltransferase [Salmonella enterica]|uniref:site-specific DNA-methyltransferase (adenine-specific) n=1 Tax=Salmonella enterica TaxID=28901 RepID=A0A402XDT9_SALER|nr:site-specific DNA-methyltransferase [Salmonella enterica]ECI3493643.1 site-specific DNA-methyltransferase [Salmonella enterica subsp. salamae]EDV3119343.1 site-specific DNA-methyltransferase [Salmonella enterica subsp. enterica]EBA4607915.1 site-specific DNA-methyltransferase [Salmonella enterica]EBQ2947095.1 site-specific DNA-methyltransferase [Salmonella enterica]